MEVLTDAEDELILAYRGWLKSPPKLLVPLLVPAGATFFILAISGSAPYPWIVSLFSLWMCLVGLILSHDLHREFVWRFDRMSKTANYSVIRPPHFKYVTRTLF
jgi:hypothetical protein